MVVGGCCSGKSTRSLEIKKYLEEKGKKVQLISDSDCFDDKNFFYESKKNKKIKKNLKHFQKKIQKMKKMQEEQ